MYKIFNVSSVALMCLINNEVFSWFMLCVLALSGFLVLAEKIGEQR